MARISTYIKDTNLSNQDMVIGTDYDNNNATVNFPLNVLAEYVSQSLTPTYIFEQIIPTSTWVIQHDLESFPSVTIVDSANNVVVGYQMYNNNNQITLQFSAPFAGKAYLN